MPLTPPAAAPNLNARISLRAGLLVLLCGLASCGWFGGHKDTGSVTPVSDAGYTDPNVPAAPEIVPGTKQSNTQQEAGATLQVNKYLWRGALETLGFMPFASADPFGGVIVTEWYSPNPGSNERFKATCYVLGRELRSDGVHVTIFRQVRDAGQWTDAPPNPSTATDIENKILARARELRAQSAG
jgi:hypothetical protein